MGIRSEEIVVQLKGDRIVTINVILSGFIDDNYGADYDGNRGTQAVFIEDLSLQIPDVDDAGDPLDENDRDEIAYEIDRRVTDGDFELDDHDHYDDYDEEE